MKKFIILIPLYNDWQSVLKLLEKIDLQIKNWDAKIDVVIVNDASTEVRPDLSSNLKKIKQIKILNMKQNRVHQRCIAAGLKYICANEDFDHIVVMDADGEDRPEELNDFYKITQDQPEITVTANRFKRSEGIIFRFLYEVHKLITLIFTGKLIKFGNFTCLTKAHAHQLIKKADLWNSYSSSVIKTINHRIYIPSTRGIRYVLPSKINFFGLVFHSLTIISVFRIEVIIRSIIFLLAYLFLVMFFSINILFPYPIFILLAFVLTILKISMRSNKEGLDKSLENIDSVDILLSSNSGQ